MSNEEPLVLHEFHDAVALLTLNRPERHHALSQALCAELETAIDRAEADPEVRVLVITGSGERAFCAGADMLEASGVEAPGARTGSAQRIYARLAAAEKPVIAAVNGYCYGGGARLAIGCDIRLASENASFRLPGSEYGLVVAAATLPRLVGAAKAKELLFTARAFGADEALSCGLVNAVYPQAELVPAALAMARVIASHSAEAIRAAKKVIDAATLSDEARAMEDEANRRLRGSPEQTARFRSATQRVTGR
jgi:enoyl-CoA hydratase/carnithine racemase